MAKKKRRLKQKNNRYSFKRIAGQPKKCNNKARSRACLNQKRSGSPICNGCSAY